MYRFIFWKQQWHLIQYWGWGSWESAGKLFAVWWAHTQDQGLLQDKQTEESDRAVMSQRDTYLAPAQSPNQRMPEVFRSYFSSMNYSSEPINNVTKTYKYSSQTD